MIKSVGTVGYFCWGICDDFFSGGFRVERLFFFNLFLRGRFFYFLFIFFEYVVGEIGVFSNQVYVVEQYMMKYYYFYILK